MINRLRKLLSGELETPAGNHAADELQLAAASLLVEAARLDGVYDAIERDALTGALMRRFELSGEETESLIEAAEQAQDDSAQLHRFVKTIRDDFSADERIEMIEMLWEVVYADGELHPYEANLMRRVGGLLYVTDRDRGAARKRVLERIGSSS